MSELIGALVPREQLVGILSVGVDRKEPTLEEITITENGIYLAPMDIDGYDKIEVAIYPVLEELEVKQNGTYIPDEGIDGFAEVRVAVPEPVLEAITLTGNGNFIPPTGVDGYNDITVEIDTSTILPSSEEVKW